LPQSSTIKLSNDETVDPSTVVKMRGLFSSKLVTFMFIYGTHFFLEGEPGKIRKHEWQNTCMLMFQQSKISPVHSIIFVNQKFHLFKQLG
jgi:hypothetical protein